MIVVFTPARTRIKKSLIPLPKIVRGRRLNLSDTEERPGIGGGDPGDLLYRKLF